MCTHIETALYSVKISVYFVITRMLMNIIVYLAITHMLMKLLVYLRITHMIIKIIVYYVHTCSCVYLTTLLAIIVVLDAVVRVQD